MTRFDLELLSSFEQRELLCLLEKEARRKSRRRILTFYPATGPLRRKLYLQRMKFFRAAPARLKGWCGLWCGAGRLGCPDIHVVGPAHVAERYPEPAAGEVVARKAR